MAVCDYCGETYQGSAISDGIFWYCTGHCHERGMALRKFLDGVPQAEIDRFVARAHAGPCGGCGKSETVDVYQSHQILSALVYSSWQTNSYVVCRRCARKRQLSDLALCLVAGWWSLPGLFMTPLYIVFNIMALYTVELTAGPGGCVIEWSPREPSSLDKKEIEAYRKARDAFLASVAERMGGKVVVVEV